MKRTLEKLPGPASLPELVEMEREKVEDQRPKGLPGKDLCGLKDDEWPLPWGEPPAPTGHLFSQAFCLSVVTVLSGLACPGGAVFSPAFQTLFGCSNTSLCLVRWVCASLTPQHWGSWAPYLSVSKWGLITGCGREFLSAGQPSAVTHCQRFVCVRVRM